MKLQICVSRSVTYRGSLVYTDVGVDANRPVRGVGERRDCRERVGALARAASCASVAPRAAPPGSGGVLAARLGEIGPPAAACRRQGGRFASRSARRGRVGTRSLVTATTSDSLPSPFEPMTTMPVLMRSRWASASCRSSSLPRPSACCATNVPPANCASSIAARRLTLLAARAFDLELADLARQALGFGLELLDRCARALGRRSQRAEHLLEHSSRRLMKLRPRRRP